MAIRDPVSFFCNHESVVFEWDLSINVNMETLNVQGNYDGIYIIILHHLSCLQIEKFTLLKQEWWIQRNAINCSKNNNLIRIPISTKTMIIFLHVYNVQLGWLDVLRQSHPSFTGNSKGDRIYIYTDGISTCMIYILLKANIYITQNYLMAFAHLFESSLYIRNLI